MVYMCDLGCIQCEKVYVYRRLFLKFIYINHFPETHSTPNKFISFLLDYGC